MKWASDRSLDLGGWRNGIKTHAACVLVFLSCFFLFFSACRHVEGTNQGARSSRGFEEKSWKKTELYFGLDRTSGKEWKAFVDGVVLPRFPKGFTVLEAEGYWLSQGVSQTNRELSKVLIVLHPATKESDARLESIREEYKKRFGQESVMRVDYPSRVSF